MRIRGYARIGLSIALEIMAILALHAVGSRESMQVNWHHLSTWLSTSQLDTLLVASIRVMALVIAYYLAITTVLYTVASALKIYGLTRILELATLPAVRQSIDRAIAVGALTATVIGGTASVAHAASNSPFPDGIVIPSGNTQDTGSSAGDNPFPFPSSDSTTTTAPKTTTTTAPKTTPTTTDQTPTVDTPTPTPVPPQVQGEQTYKVVPGDNLWNIAKAHLAQTQGVDAKTLSDHDIAKYWLQVIDTNRSNLRSGDPDLIYPGESITLPDAGVSSGS